MKNVKTKLLLSSGALAAIAAILAIGATIFVDQNSNPITYVKVFACSGYVSLLGLTTFFVGLAYPKDR